MTDKKTPLLPFASRSAGMPVPTNDGASMGLVLASCVVNAVEAYAGALPEFTEAQLAGLYAAAANGIATGYYALIHADESPTCRITIEHALAMSPVGSKPVFYIDMNTHDPGDDDPRGPWEPFNHYAYLQAKVKEAQELAEQRQTGILILRKIGGHEMNICFPGEARSILSNKLPDGWELFGWTLPEQMKAEYRKEAKRLAEQYDAPALIAVKLQMGPGPVVEIIPPAEVQHWNIYQTMPPPGYHIIEWVHSDREIERRAAEREEHKRFREGMPWMNQQARPSPIPTFATAAFLSFHGEVLTAIAATQAEADATDRRVMIVKSPLSGTIRPLNEEEEAVFRENTFGYTLFAYVFPERMKRDARRIAQAGAIRDQTTALIAVNRFKVDPLPFVIEPGSAAEYLWNPPTFPPDYHILEIVTPPAWDGIRCPPIFGKALFAQARARLCDGFQAHPLCMMNRYPYDEIRVLTEDERQKVESGELSLPDGWTVYGWSIPDKELEEYRKTARALANGSRFPAMIATFADRPIPMVVRPNAVKEFFLSPDTFPKNWRLIEIIEPIKPEPEPPTGEAIIDPESLPFSAYREGILPQKPEATDAK